MPEGPAIEKAMRRRLIGFDVSKVDWSTVAINAGGLSAADVVAAAEDAARRAVLGNTSLIETSALITSLGHRRSLQEIGGTTDDKRQTAPCPKQDRPQQNRKQKRVRGQNTSIRKKTSR